MIEGLYADQGLRFPKASKPQKWVWDWNYYLSISQYLLYVEGSA